MQCKEKNNKGPFFEISFYFHPEEDYVIKSRPRNSAMDLQMFCHTTNTVGVLILVRALEE